MLRPSNIAQKRRHLQNPFVQWVRSLSAATGTTLGLFVLAGALAISWIAGVDPIVAGFEQLHLWQNTPHWLVQVPEIDRSVLLAPLVAVWLVAVGTIRLSPQPRLWSRTVIISITIGLMVRYLLWRSLTTLNFSDPLNGFVSVLLFGLELFTILLGSTQLWMALRMTDRRGEADGMSVAVLEGTYRPSVDILIPSYNEPTSILQRTIIGCQAIDYPDKKVYLLDDTRRPEIQQLCQELGCEYVTRPTSDHAKAGNLNHAIAHTSGELIAFFDADFIPTTNFLNRTLGYFQDPSIGMVQTPQTFYNPDPIARNLGLENVLLPEEEFFYRQIQPSRDGLETTICAGTSFVARRSALEENNGFVTDALTEDYFTGINLMSKGYRIVYLDDKLSAGLSAQSIADHLAQRMRWCQGNIQGFFIASNPLTILGLTFRQRIANLEGLLYWFAHVANAGFLLMPLSYALFKTTPVQGTIPEILYFFLPYYWIQLTAFSWLNRRSRSMFLSSIYGFISCLPLSATIFKTVLDPFEKAFKVTPKGIIRHRFELNWSLAWPLLLLAIATMTALFSNVNSLLKGELDGIVGIGFGLFWTVYNLVILCVSLWVLWDAPQKHDYEWYEFQTPIRFNPAISEEENWFTGESICFAEVGMEVELERNLSSQEIEQLQGVDLNLVMDKYDLHLQGEVARIETKNGKAIVHIDFLPYWQEQKRKIIEILYCRPGQWKMCKTPNEFMSLVWLVKAAMMPAFIFLKYRKVNLNFMRS